jgi:phosphoglucomutase
MPTTKKTILSLLLLAAMPQTGAPQVTHVHNGFLKTEAFVHMSTDGKRDYAKGLVDGMLLAPLFGAPDDGDKIKSFGACIEGMSDTQVAAIIEKFARDHPERWNESLNWVAFTAMTQGCARK